MVVIEQEDRRTVRDHGLGTDDLDLVDPTTIRI